MSQGINVLSDKWSYWDKKRKVTISLNYTLVFSGGILMKVFNQTLQNVGKIFVTQADTYINHNSIEPTSEVFQSFVKKHTNESQPA